jgi:hypothetical protein
MEAPCVGKKLYACGSNSAASAGFSAEEGACPVVEALARCCCRCLRRRAIICAMSRGWLAQWVFNTILRSVVPCGADNSGAELTPVFTIGYGDSAWRRLASYPTNARTVDTVLPRMFISLFGGMFISLFWFDSLRARTSAFFLGSRKKFFVVRGFISCHLANGLHTEFLHAEMPEIWGLDRGK